MLHEIVDHLHRYILSKLQIDYWCGLFTKDIRMGRCQDQSTALVRVYLVSDVVICNLWLLTSSCFHDLWLVYLHGCNVVNYQIVTSQQQLYHFAIMLSIGTLLDMKDSEV